MSNSVIDTMSSRNIEAMFEYLSDQLDAAETKDDISGILELIHHLLSTPATSSAVQGLGHLRVEYAPILPTPANTQYREAPHAPADGTDTVRLAVPSPLAATFESLAIRMSTLHDQDHESYVNATNALEWLACGDITRERL